MAKRKYSKSDGISVPFDVTDFGATGDGEALQTEAIQAAVDACADAGGGTVLVPAGEYVTAPIFLRSDVQFHLAAGATLLGSTTFEDYPVVDGRDAGVEREMYAALLTAEDAENVAITGRGTIDGRGEPWWDAYWQDLEVFDEHDLDREDWYPPPEDAIIQYPRPRLINPIRCENVLLRDLTLRNSPFWTVQPLYCENVTVDNITVVNPEDSPNTDGINPDSCKNVRIANCHLDVGDDCVTLKSGYNEDGRRVGEPLENVTVTGCTMKRGHGGVVIGSETAGDIRNVAVSNCVFDGTNRGLRIKSARGRGGVVENVRASNVVMRDIQKEAVTITLYYPHDPKPEATDPQAIPTVRDVHYSNLLVDGVDTAATIRGLPESHLSDVSLANVVVDDATTGLQISQARNVALDQMSVEATETPPVEAESVDALTLDRVTGTVSKGPLARFEDVSRGLVRCCTIPTDADAIVRDAEGSSEVRFEANTRWGDETADISG
jgi:hypothetical protein